MKNVLTVFTHCGEVKGISNLSNDSPDGIVLRQGESVELSKARKRGKKKGKKRDRKGNIGALIRWAGKVGYTGAKESLEGKEGIRTPEKLAGWLKGQAKKKGVLSPEHPYVGRKKKKVKKSLIPFIPERNFSLVKWEIT